MLSIPPSLVMYPPARHLIKVINIAMQTYVQANTLISELNQFGEGYAIPLRIFSCNSKNNYIIASVGIVAENPMHKLDSSFIFSFI